MAAIVPRPGSRPPWAVDPPQDSWLVAQAQKLLESMPPPIPKPKAKPAAPVLVPTWQIGGDKSVPPAPRPIARYRNGEPVDESGVLMVTVDEWHARKKKNAAKKRAEREGDSKPKPTPALSVTDRRYSNVSTGHPHQDTTAKIRELIAKLESDPPYQRRS